MEKNPAKISIIALHIFCFSKRLTFNDQFSDPKTCIDKESRCSMKVARTGMKFCKHQHWRDSCKKSCLLCGMKCLDHALQNVKNRRDMEDAGWIVYVERDRNERFAANCGGYESFWGRKIGTTIGYVEATFKGKGRGTLDFENCFTRGQTKVYLNNRLVAAAESGQKSVVVSFYYKKGDVLKITEEEHGVIKINSFKIEGCEHLR